MQIGISITSAYGVSDPREGARQMIARVRAARDAGLDSLFVGDHHVTPAPYYQNTPILGRLLADWDDRPAGALFLLPLWNPVLVAEQVATLAAIAQGPFILQTGLGRGAGVFAAMGTDIRNRPSAFEQSLDVIRRLWRGEEVSLDGRWRIARARVSPLPPEPVPVWIGASAAPAIDRAARLGDAWLADPSLTFDQAALAVASYHAALERHGRQCGTMAIRRDVHITASASETRAVREQVRTRGYRGFDPSALLIGEATEVVEQIAAFGELGFTDILVRNLHTDGDEALRSTERMGRLRELIHQQRP